MASGTDEGEDTPMAAVLPARRQGPPALDLPRGDGHAVLVLPALFAIDGFLDGLRHDLAAAGFAPQPWGQGVNLGPTPRALDLLEATLDRLHEGEGPVSLAGHSMGGLYARWLAIQHPGKVRRVVTLCSPFAPPAIDRALPVIRLAGGFRQRGFDLARLAEPPPVPSLAIYSRSDRIVPWQGCRERIPTPRNGNAEVAGRHGGMAANPAAVALVLRELAAR